MNMSISENRSDADTRIMFQNYFATVMMFCFGWGFFGCFVLLGFFWGVVCGGFFVWVWQFWIGFVFWLVGSVKLFLVLVCTKLITISSSINRSEEKQSIT